ncbi:hemolysin III family protein [Myxococcota bacterium]|nr:hemolysin III family protein [Myxococcota bacterium]MBU1430745.1 hemolysin III family protein [Myxococcota bacterium]MBU1897147.1 hemolysin III family protein [Myxococcota bacterium]
MDQPRRCPKDPFSALSHFIGFLGAIAGLTALLLLSPPEWPKRLGFGIYGLSLMAVFGASATYHFFDLGEAGNRRLRRLDHAAIFLLISGTYTPTLIHSLDGAWRISMLAVMGGLALTGVVVKLLYIGGPRWLTAGLYLAMGWMILVPGGRLTGPMSAWTFGWVLAGGLLYSLGAVIYALKRPDPWPGRFGFHEIWHLFVLAAGVAHYIFVYSLLDAPYAPF